jgi:hypothetical protein
MLKGVKFIGGLMVAAVITYGCSSDSQSDKEKELELREKELALKEKELSLQESNNLNKDNLSSNNNQIENKSNKSSLNQSNSNTQTKPKQKSQEEIKLELALKECESPTNYLSHSNTKLEGIFKNAVSMKFVGFKLKFNVTNSASILTFKNIRCRVVLTSNSGSIILSTDFTVNEFIKAGNTIAYNGEFSCTNQQLNDTDKYVVQILGAECH